jgi:hypothetical protein
MANKKRVSFRATKIVKKPVLVRFRRSDGSIAKFKATKAVRKPVRVSFLVRRKRRK